MFCGESGDESLPDPPIVLIWRWLLPPSVVNTQWFAFTDATAPAPHLLRGAISLPKAHPMLKHHQFGHDAHRVARMGSVILSA